MTDPNLRAFLHKRAVSQLNRCIYRASTLVNALTHHPAATSHKEPAAPIASLEPDCEARRIAAEVSQAAMEDAQAIVAAAQATLDVLIELNNINQNDYITYCDPS